MKLTKQPPRLIDPSALTIDDIDAANTPSLIGFWRGDGNADGSLLYDYSGNNYHLDVSHQYVPALPEAYKQFQTRAEIFSHRPGWFTLAPGMLADIDAVSTLLDLGTKTVIITGEFRPENTLHDCDCGTAWNHSNTGTYAGIIIGGQANSFYGKVSAPFGDTTVCSGYQVVCTPNSEVVVAIGWRPGTSLVQSVNGGALSTHTTNAASITTTPLQEGKFGFGPSDSHERISVRNYQIWAFTATPYNMNMTVEWMSHNPGKIPPWWIGR